MGYTEDSVLNDYCTIHMHNINYMQILKACLQHVLIQVYHLQIEQNTNFKTRFQ